MPQGILMAMFESVRQDLAHALRILRTAPGHAIAAVLTLGVGIACATSLFSVVDGVLLRSLPYDDAGSLMSLWVGSPERHLPRIAVTPAEYDAWRAGQHSFRDLAASQPRRFVVTNAGEDAVRVTGAMVSTNYFDVMGIHLLVGHAFDANDSLAASRVILSQAFWTSRFGAARDVAGKTITLDGSPYTVVGVTASRSAGALNLFIPLTVPPVVASDRDAHALIVTGRLRAHVPVASATQDLGTVLDRLGSDYPATDKAWTPIVVPLLSLAVGNVRPAVVTLSVAAGLLLLIACVNVGGLTLIRLHRRAREFAIRSVLGAGRARVASQLVAESAVIALGGAAVGLTLALLAVGAFHRLAPTSLPRAGEVSVSLPVLGFSIAITLVAAVLLAAAQIRYSLRAELAPTLRDGGRGVSGSRHRRRFHHGLVVIQVMLAIVVTMNATLFVRRFVTLTRTTLGFDPADVVTGHLVLPPQRYPSAQAQALFADELADSLAHLPNVTAAALADALPVDRDGTPLVLFAIRGRPAPSSTERPAAYTVAVSPDYFKALGIPLLRGRGFTRQDRAGSRPVVIVDQELVHQYFQDRDPLGQLIAFVGDSVAREVVGVVGTVKQVGPQVEDRPGLYGPLAQFPGPDLRVVVKGNAGPLGRLVRGIRGAATGLDAEVPLLEVEPLEGRMSEVLAPQRLYATVGSGFALVALFLGGIGLYGTLAFAISQQAKEIGLRLALGASPILIRNGVVRTALFLTTMGLVAGGIGMLVIGSMLKSLVASPGSYDALSFEVVSLTYVSVAVIAAALPAYRASRVDPLESMRAE